MIKCKDCKFLYIKDFITGICENENTGVKLVKPDDGCEHGEALNTSHNIDIQTKIERVDKK